MGETKLSPLPCPAGIPEWMWREVSEYDLPLTFTPATVLDIGANIGAFTLLAKQRWPLTLVHAYEPVDDNLEGLFQNTNALPGVTVQPVAVRGFNGPADILLGDRGVTCSFHQLGRQTNQVERCRCVDAASLPSCDVIKIDTEGCELEIVQRLNLAETKVLCVEYHFLDDVPHLKHLAELNDLKLNLEKPLGDTWGILIFARAGAIAAPQPSTLDPRPSTDPKVFVALPVYGGLDVFFTQSLLKFLNEPPCPIALRMNPGDSLVSRSRNTLTADFLESDATHLLFIDTDLIFSSEQVARLLAHDKDIVAGFYPKKQEGPVQWVCNAHLGEDRPIGADGLQEVRYMGTGFMLVKRGVFETMIARYPALAFKADHRDRIEHDFWSVGVYHAAADFNTPAVQPGRYLSEDWFFCQRALDAGFKVWGDTRVVLKHVGQAIYPLRSQEAELLSGVTAGNGTPGNECVRPALAPALSCRDATAGDCAAAPERIETLGSRLQTQD